MKECKLLSVYFILDKTFNIDPVSTSPTALARIIVENTKLKKVPIWQTG